MASADSLLNFPQISVCIVSPFSIETLCMGNRVEEIGLWILHEALKRFEIDAEFLMVLFHWAAVAISSGFGQYPAGNSGET